MNHACQGFGEDEFCACVVRGMKIRSDGGIMRLPRIPVLGLSDEEEGEEEEASVALTEVEISIEGGGGVKVFLLLSRWSQIPRDDYFCKLYC